MAKNKLDEDVIKNMISMRNHGFTCKRIGEMYGITPQAVIEMIVNHDEEAELGSAEEFYELCGTKRDEMDGGSSLKAYERSEFVKMWNDARIAFMKSRGIVPNFDSMDAGCVGKTKTDDAEFIENFRKEWSAATKKLRRNTA